MKSLHAALLIIGALAAQAQEKGSISIVDAVALDSSGSAVTNLTAADFEITSGGNPAPAIRVTAFDTVRHTAATSTSQPALELTPDQIHRITVFVVDDLCLSASELHRYREWLNHFAADLLAPGDQAAILRTSGGSNRFRQLTTGRTQLKEIIDGTEYLGGSVTPQACAAAAWTTVGYALAGLARFSGRKSVVLLSGDLRGPLGNAAAELERLAAASMTAVYPVSAEARVFAESTGGAAGVDLDRVTGESGSYYALSFLTGNRDLEVKVKRPGLTLRARRLPAGTPPPEDFPARSSDAGNAVDAMNSPFEGGAIGVRVTPLFTNTPAEGSLVEVLCYIDAHDLSYLCDEQGAYHVEFEVGADSAIEGGRITRTYMHRQELHLSADEYRRALDEGLLVNMRLAWGSGPRDVRVVVVDERSGSMGGASAFVQVHNFGAGVFFLSSIAVQAESHLKQSAAVRTFRGGAKLTFVYNIFNATVDAEGRSRVEVRSRLVAGGRDTYQGQPSAIVFVNANDTRRRQVTGHIQLDPAIGRGRYILQVTVTDLLAAQPRTAGQFIDFTVQP